MFFEFQTYITNLTVNNYIIFLHYHNNKQLSQRIWYFIIFKILKIPLVLLIRYQKNSTKEREKKDKFLDTIKVPQSFYKIPFNQAIIVIFRDQFHRCLTSLWQNCVRTFARRFTVRSFGRSSRHSGTSISECLSTCHLAFQRNNISSFSISATLSSSSSSWFSLSASPLLDTPVFPSFLQDIAVNRSLSFRIFVSLQAFLCPTRIHPC